MRHFPKKRNIQRAGAFLLALLFAFLSACSDAEGGESRSASATESRTPPTQPVIGAQSAPLTIAWYGERTLNPYRVDNRLNQMICRLLYDSLFTLGPSFTPEPMLCQDVTRNGNVYTLTLRQDVTFSDGRHLSAQDVLYSLEAAMEEDSIYADSLRDVVSIHSPGDYTVEITLAQESGFFLRLLDIPIVAKDTGELDIPVGCGRYQLFYDDDGDPYLGASSYWYGDPLPLNQISLVSVEKPSSLMFSFESGILDLAVEDRISPTPVHIKGSYQLTACPTSNMHYIGVNTRQAPLDDPLVRRAISLAIDRGSIASQALSGFADAASLPIHPRSPEGASLTQEQNPLPDLARIFLTEAGLTLDEETGLYGRTDRRGAFTPLSLTLLVNTENAFKSAAAEIMAENLIQAGIGVTITAVPFTEFSKLLENRDFDLYIGETVLPPDFDISALIKKDGALNFAGFQDDLLESAFDAYFASAGTANQSSALAAYVSAFSSQSPFIPYAFEQISVLNRQTRVDNITPTSRDLFYRMEDWKVYVEDASVT